MDLSIDNLHDIMIKHYKANITVTVEKSANLHTKAITWSSKNYKTA